MRLFQVEVKRPSTGTKLDVIVWAAGRWDARTKAMLVYPGWQWMDVNLIEHRRSQYEL